MIWLFGEDRMSGKRTNQINRYKNEIEMAGLEDLRENTGCSSRKE